MRSLKNIWALYKKEIRAYFTSPIAYVLLTIFLLIAGYFYYVMVASYQNIMSNPEYMPYIDFNIGELILRPFFGNLSVIMLFFIPILTMRLVAEERQTGTLKLLLSYPIRDVEVLAAKFLSAVSVLFIMFLLTFPLPVFLFALSDPEIGPFIANYLGILLLGASFISLGLFASSITERQVVAAVISFGFLIIFWVINWIKDVAGFKFGTILDEISILSHMDNFTKGVIITHDIVYYILFTAFFFFLALIALGSRTWRSK
jgi:ABC-2 type transport system permease protein